MKSIKAALDPRRVRHYPRFTVASNRIQSIKVTGMVLTKGVLALVEAKPGQEKSVRNFLNGGPDMVIGAPGTKTRYAFRVNENTFGIFDTFETEEGRQAHLGGAIPPALAQYGPDLLVKDPDIKLVDVIAVK